MCKLGIRNKALPNAQQAWIFTCLALCTAASFAADLPLRVQSITPSGNDVPVPQQIVITFNQAMIRLGQTQQTGDQPVAVINPIVGCDWRWINDRSAACQLNATTPLKRATRYSVTVPTALPALSGARLAKPATTSFITQRPRYRRNSFDQWLSPGTPSWKLYFEQPVTKASVAASLTLLDSRGRQYPIRVSAPKKSYYAKGLQWQLQPRAELPLDRDYKLRVTPGLAGYEGRQKGQQNTTIASFSTFADFNWNSIRCRSINGKTIQRLSHETHELACDPDRDVELSFNSPVLEADFLTAMQLSPVVASDKKGGKYSRRGWRDNSKGYRYSLPAPLQPRQNYALQVAQLSDEFGRRLPSPIQLKFSTSRRAKHLEITHPNAFVESDVAHTDVPFATVNQANVTVSYERLTAQGYSAERQTRLDLPPAKDITLLNPLGLKALLNSSSGAASGTISAASDSHNANPSKPFFAQMSPFQISAKLGYANSLLWVTDMKTGTPIADATIRLHITSANNLKALAEPALITTKTDANGLAQFGGRTSFEDLPQWPAWKTEQPRLTLTVAHNDDLAILPLDSRFSVNLWGVAKDVWQQPAAKHGHAQAWGTTAQGIYSAGDKVDYKIWVRDAGTSGLTPAPAGQYKITVHDPKGDQIHSEKDITLSSTGSHSGEFSLNKNAQSGWYEIRVEAPFGTLSAVRLMVSDFTPAPFKVTNSLAKPLYRTGDTVIADTEARLHAGGPYTGSNTRVTGRIRQSALKTTNPLAQEFRFDTSSGQSRSDLVLSEEQKLNNEGTLETRFTLASSSILYGKLLLESAVADERGKDIAAYTSADYAGREQYVGIRAQHWLGTAGREDWFEALVVNSEGEPTSNHPIELIIEHRETYAARVKGPGSAFLTEYKHRWAEVTRCQLTSQQTEGQRCPFTPEKAGNYRATAVIEDSNKREHKSREWLWVSGSDEIVWDRGNGHGTRVEAEKSSYQLGETARFLVQNPYPGAQALITIERYGILKQWVQALPHSTAVIEVPIEADYVPGFYLGVHIVSPRVATPGPDPEARPGTYVDLGKPTFAIGYSKMLISQPIKRIDVEVKTDKPVYRPKQSVKVTLQAKPRIAALPLQGPTELTVVVLDEAVFDLVPGRAAHYDPYQGFYNLDSLDVQTFTTLQRLVGRIGFSRKGANPGGDGGGSPALRNLFKFVAHWQPSLMTDANGKAEFEFQLPDNLTGWRILVLANDSAERFGLGQGQFKVNQPTELRAVMPNHVYAGDQLMAGVSVMNRTDKTRLLHLTMTAAGDIAAEQSNSLLTSINVAPFQRKIIRLPIQARWRETEQDSIGRPRRISFTVTAEPADGKASDGDALRFSLPVLAKLHAETVATYGSLDPEQGSAEATVALAIPKDIIAKRSTAGFRLSPSLIGPLDNNFAYMRDYPYLCWEQRSSKALMAQHYLQLKDYFGAALEWPDAQQLVQTTLTQAGDFQAPSGGMGYFQADDARVSPYLSTHTAWAFQQFAEAGYNVPAAVQQKLLSYLQTLQREDRFPSYYGLSGRSNTRAMILAVLAKASLSKDADFERIDIQQLTTFGLSWLLRAQLAHKPSATSEDSWKLQRQRVINALLARSNQSSGGLSFADDSQPWLLGSSQRNQCAVLSAIIEDQTSTTPSSALQGRAKQLARHLLQSPQRQKHGWQGTQETLYCATALAEFAAVYESTPLQAQLTAWLDQRGLGTARFSDRRDAAVELAQPLRPEELGSDKSLRLQHSGQGRVYYAAKLNYTRAELPTQAQQAGMSLQREYSILEAGQWRLLKKGEVVTTGQQIRVDLYLQTPGQHYYVVVNDPLPSALEAVNTNLATSSSSAASGAYSRIANDSLAATWSKQSLAEPGSFYHKELRHRAAQFYADELAAGRYRLSYIAQVIAAGQFSAIPAHAEAMYQPEVFGNSSATALHVLPSQ